MDESFFELDLFNESFDPVQITDSMIQLLQLTAHWRERMSVKSNFILGIFIFQSYQKTESY